jgi:hypothetical protein
MSFIEMLGDAAGVEAAPPIPGPPPRTAPAPKRGQPRRDTADDTDRDDEYPDQLDLF